MKKKKIVSGSKKIVFNKKLHYLFLIFFVVVAACTNQNVTKENSAVITPVDTVANGADSIDSEAGTTQTDNVKTDNIKEITEKIDSSKGTFGFEGFGPGKSHKGTFDEWSGVIHKTDRITSVEFEINPETVNTGIEALDNHLKSEDFFDVAKYPEIKFVSSKIKYGAQPTITGILTFRGQSNEISFPFVPTEKRMTGDFFIDTELYGMKYIGVKKDVRIFFDLEI